MNGENISPGSVFVSYAHDDYERVKPLVKYLADKGLTVWWDEQIEPGTSFRNAIQEMLDVAACVVVVWTVNSVERDFVRSEASIGQERGVLVPVRFDSEARIPVGFTELNYVDLITWDGAQGRKRNKELKRALKRIRALAARGPYKAQYSSTLKNSQWYLDNSQSSVTELQSLALRFRSIGELMLADSRPAKDLRGALREVSKTYHIVNTAILRFLKPAVQSKAIRAAPYIKMERGTLKDKIRRGRGHCHAILTHYGRAGGLRDWVKDKLTPQQLQEADDVFARLGTADGDLFRSLVEVGDLLTNEARVIANLLMAKQKAAARQRILEGRIRLAPLEEQLKTAMQELQELEASLGYV